jgi:hypothetical protein
MSDAVGFASLCGHIHHALVDDGEINFIAVNGSPRITFLERWIEGFEDRVLTDQERDFKANGIGGRKREYTVSYFDGVASFIAAADLYEAESLKKCFLWDARRQGVDFAVEHYGKRPFFQQAWIDLIPPQPTNDGGDR